MAWYAKGGLVLLFVAMIGAFYAFLAHREDSAYLRGEEAGKEAIQKKWDKDRGEWNDNVLRGQLRDEEQAKSQRETWRLEREADKADLLRLRALTTGRTCLSTDAVRVLQDIGNRPLQLPPLPSTSTPTASSGVPPADTRVATDTDVSETLGELRGLYAEVKKQCDGLIGWSIENLVKPNQKAQ